MLARAHAFERAYALARACACERRAEEIKLRERRGGEQRGGAAHRRAAPDDSSAAPRRCHAFPSVASTRKAIRAKRSASSEAVAHELLSVSTHALPN
eukprot:5004454-Pleurochrysis_carterae.AAC.1